LVLTVPMVRPDLQVLLDQYFLVDQVNPEGLVDLHSLQDLMVPETLQVLVSQQILVFLESLRIRVCLSDRRSLSHLLRPELRDFRDLQRYLQVLDYRQSQTDQFLQ